MVERRKKPWKKQNISQAGWSVKFGPNDVGDSIMCPNCGSGLIDSDSGRFQEGVLMDAEEIKTD